VSDVLPLGDGRFRVTEAGRSRLAYGVRANSTGWVFIEGQVYVIRDEGSGIGDRGGGRHDDLSLAAPMPATVATIHVAPGQTVAPGDVLITLEAMKMEMAIRAPRAGTITAIACRTGELVQPGIPLVELA
jgi:biotin carboxyl carrier protein